MGKKFDPNLGERCKIRLREGRLMLTAANGAITTLEGPNVTLELIVLDGGIEVVGTLSTHDDGSCELWPFDDVPAANTKDAAVTNEELVALEQLLREAL